MPGRHDGGRRRHQLRASQGGRRSRTRGALGRGRAAIPGRRPIRVPNAPDDPAGSTGTALTRIATLNMPAGHPLAPTTSSAQGQAANGRCEVEAARALSSWGTVTCRAGSSTPIRRSWVACAAGCRPVSSTSFLAGRVRRAQAGERTVHGVADVIIRPFGRVEEGLHPDAEDYGEEEPSGFFRVDVFA